jgi:hypothetical protein
VVVVWGTGTECLNGAENSNHALGQYADEFVTFIEFSKNFFETGSCYIAQADLELSISSQYP